MADEWPDIVVTDEMRQAGAKIIADAYNTMGLGVDELKAEDIFRTMLAARCKGGQERR